MAESPDARPQSDREPPVQRSWRTRLMRFLRRHPGRWFTVAEMARGARLVPWAVERAVAFNLTHDAERPGLYRGVLEARRDAEGELVVRFDGERYRANREALLERPWRGDVRAEERLHVLPRWLWSAARAVVARLLRRDDAKAGAEDG